MGNPSLRLSEVLEPVHEILVLIPCEAAKAQVSLHISTVAQGSLLLKVDKPLGQTFGV